MTTTIGELIEACHVPDFEACEREQARALVSGEGFWRLVVDDEYGCYLQSTDYQMYEIEVTRLTANNALNVIMHLTTKEWAHPHMTELLQAIQFMGRGELAPSDDEQILRRCHAIAELAGEDAEAAGRIQIEHNECRRLVTQELAVHEQMKTERHYYPGDEWQRIAKREATVKQVLASLDEQREHGRPMRARWNGFRYYVQPPTESTP